MLYTIDKGFGFVQLNRCHTDYSELLIFQSKTIKPWFPLYRKLKSSTSVLLKEVRQHPEKFVVDQYPAEMCITISFSDHVLLFFLKPCITLLTMLTNN